MATSTLDVLNEKLEAINRDIANIALQIQFANETITTANARLTELQADKATLESAVAALE